MSLFSQIHTMYAQVLQGLLESQPICKLLYYESDDPLAEADIAETRQLLNTHIMYSPKLPNAVESVPGAVAAYIDEMAPGEDNPRFIGGQLVFDIAVHAERWELANDRIRPWLLLHEIDDMLLRLLPAGHEGLTFYQAKQTNFNDSYYGYRLSYRFYELSGG